MQLLQNLDVSKSNGPDRISAKMLKGTSCSIASCLTKLFNISIQSGSVPCGWKLSMIVPISKDGEKSVPTNYRPISLLPIVSKILERHIHSKIMLLLQGSYPISDNNGAPVQKNPLSMSFSQLWMTGSNHLRQEQTLELFFRPH